MKRKIYDELLRWKREDNGKTAVLIDGARRVGKSYVAEEFAKSEYKTYLLIDFAKADETVKSLFLQYLDDLDTFFLLLSSYYKTTFYKRDTLIIFDEVQFFPRARSAIKYLVQDGRYDYLETGSLMSIKKNVQDILIPSEEIHLKMHPMDFEEFLWAVGEENLVGFIQRQFSLRQPMGQLLHRKAMLLLREYLIVGGMPQAVRTFIETKNFALVDRAKQGILELYRGDIVKHAAGCEIKAKRIFDELPAQLSRHEKTFKFSSLAKSARFRDYEDAFFWLSDAMIVNNCYNSSEPTIGLRLNMDRLTLKCYMADTGLLISHAFDEKGSVDPEVYKKILFDKLEMNEGMIVENIVAQMLVASGHKLYFYSKASRDDNNEKMEIDFLIAKSKIGSRHNISPIEVKSGKRYTLVSLRKFMKRYSEQTDSPYVIHGDDLKQEEGITYLPLYMTPLL